MTALVRRLVPYSLLPLAMVAVGLTGSPWLRAFPYGVLAVSLYGASVLSVLVPFVVFGIGIRRLWLALIIDAALFAFFELFVVLRSPGGFDQLYNGLVHGPAQILTYTLPLVSPRSLLVAPIALCWLAGALIGQTIARSWHSVLPYISLVVVFGLAYAATTRGITSSGDGHRYDTLLAVALLFVVLLLRTAQSWVDQNDSAEVTQPDGILPLRGLAVGAGAAVVIALVAAAVGQTSVFTDPPVTATRRPPIDGSRPLTPLSFVSGLRPSNPESKGRPLFTVSTDATSPNYFPIASVDTYDGDGWSFAPGRTFHPTGGVIPADIDTTLHTNGPTVTQQYTIAAGPMTRSPWMPYLYRASQVTGLPIDIDQASGMIVPDTPLHARLAYTVRSAVATSSLTQLKDPTVGGYSQIDQQRPANVTTALASLVESLHTETGTDTSGSVISFLQSVASDFRTHDSLAGDDSKTSSSTPVIPPTRSGSKSSSASPALPTQGNPAQRTGSTSFADVLTSIRQFHTGTPEQYATLMCLIARQVGVPARVVTGFRVNPPHDGKMLAAGNYHVTTADAWSWVEVPIVGQGWVVLDASPSAYSAARPPPSSAPPAAASPSASQTPNARITQANGGHAPAPPSKIPRNRDLSTLSTVVIIAIIALATSLLLLAFLVLRKRRRARRRYRAHDSRRRLIGAWQESLDLLQESGLPDLTGYTSHEVAMATDLYYGGGPASTVRAIGDSANMAIFSETIEVSDADAETAWRAHATLRRSVRRRQRPRARMISRLRFHRAARVRPNMDPSSWAELERTRTKIGGGAHR